MSALETSQQVCAFAGAITRSLELMNLKPSGNDKPQVIGRAGDE